MKRKADPNWKPSSVPQAAPAAPAEVPAAVEEAAVPQEAPQTEVTEPAGEVSSPATEPQAQAPSVFQVADAVQVLWKDQWWPAHVVEEKSGSYKIHYDQYDDSWDEWVETDRIKK